MRRVLWVAMASVLVSCGQYGEAPIFEDMTGQGRSDAELQMAQSQCRFAVRSARQDPLDEPLPSGGVHDRMGGGITRMGRAPFSPSFDNCMREQGWEIVGYE